MSVKHVAIYKCDRCGARKTIESREAKEYGYRDEFSELQKKGWKFGALAEHFKATCKKCSQMKDIT